MAAVFTAGRLRRRSRRSVAAPRAAAGAGNGDLLELGCGGGSFASHLKQQFKLTLTDLSEGMLSQSRAINPEAEHLIGDMRSLRLNRQFDYVLVHDAVCYMTTLADLRAAIETAAVHCRPGGTVIFLPDYVAETFEPGTDHGGEDAADGRGFRYLEWHADPDPSDTTYIVDYAFILREANGEVRVEHDRHIEGLFPRAVWLEAFRLRGPVRHECRSIRSGATSSLPRRRGHHDGL